MDVYIVDVLFKLHQVTPYLHQVQVTLGSAVESLMNKIACMNFGKFGLSVFVFYFCIVQNVSQCGHCDTVENGLMVVNNCV